MEITIHISHHTVSCTFHDDISSDYRLSTIFNYFPCNRIFLTCNSFRPNGFSLTDGNYSIMNRISQSAISQAFVKHFRNQFILHIQIFHSDFLRIICAVDKGKVRLFLNFPKNFIQCYISEFGCNRGLCEYRCPHQP